MPILSSREGGSRPMADYVRIDHITQGPEGQEKPTDRLSVDSSDFLWFYVYATLPSKAAPQGEYFREIDQKPHPATRTRLGSPVLIDGVYRFSVIHFVLSPGARYL